MLCLRVFCLGLQPADLIRFALVSLVELQPQEGLKQDWEAKEQYSACQLLEVLALGVCLAAASPWVRLPSGPSWPFVLGEWVGEWPWPGDK